jgi:shikimate kinase
MGTGKTSVGKALAKSLKRQFVDLDDLIEAKESTKITDVFAQKGEAYFRKVEKNALREVAQREGLVVACGGGVVLDEDNINLMKKTGKIICLASNAETILDRTKGYTHRPLLNVSGPRAKIEELLKLRAPFYAKADYRIDTSDLIIEEIVKKILEIIKKNKPQILNPKL